MKQTIKKNYTAALLTLTTVWFFWGFSAASNGVFIPFCKSHFHLSQFEAQLIDFTFYGGYFIGSIILYFISQIRGADIVNKLGYKNGIILGLLISAVGALAMGPALKSGSFGFILTADFIIALGFSLQQTAGNPFVIALGTPETGANRLNFTGGVNNIGGILGPIVVSIVLFGAASSAIDAHDVKITSMNNLYYIVAGLFLVLALFFWLSNLPTVTNDEKLETSTKPNIPLFIIFIGFCMILGVDQLSRITGIGKAYFVYAALAVIICTLISSLLAAKKSPEGWGAMQYPQLILGMIAIFTYVGTEVTIQSNLGALLKTPEFGSFKDSAISPYVSLYWGSLMIGRWAGAIGAFNLSKTTKTILTVVIPFVAFAVVLLANYLSGAYIGNLYIYAIAIVILIVCFFIGQQKPVRTLVVFGLLGVAFMTTGLLTEGMFATFCFISGGLCCSIMWPSIFALAITGLGKYTSQASACFVIINVGWCFYTPLPGNFAVKVFIKI
jgi:FHS family L-fucose permease-like MFS transporter